VARAAFARVFLLEKWHVGSKEGVKMKPSHFRQDCGHKSSSSSCTRREHGGSLLLAVLQWISSVFGTENEMLIGEPFHLSAEKDF